MKGNSEAMHLTLYIFQESECSTLVLNRNSITIRTKEQLTRLVLAVLGKTCYGYRQIKCRQSFF